MLKFHREVYMPPGLEDACLTNLVLRRGRFELSKHAREQAEAKCIRLPELIPFQRATLIEATVVDGVVQQFLIRFRYDDRLDLCMSFNPITGRVPTVWPQRCNDHHRTLRKEQYARPQPVLVESCPRRGVLVVVGRQEQEGLRHLAA